MDQQQLKNFLRSRGLKPNFTYGQNFLVDDIVLQDIVDAAEVTKEDRVLEIGPGIGTLTELLCERAGFVLAVEKDPQFLPVLKSLKKKFPDNFRYEIADALSYDFQGALIDRGTTAGADLNAERNQRQISVPISDLSASYKVVANIPYYITGKILQMLLTAKHKPETITVLTQKEVARNITARAGDLSILAISVQLFGEVKIVREVLARSFFPAPKVDSAVIQIRLFKKSKYDIGNERDFFSLLRACFSGKRKQIHNTLKNNLHLSEDQVASILSQTAISPAARPQELSIEQWIELNDKITRFKE